MHSFRAPFNVVLACALAVVLVGSIGCAGEATDEGSEFPNPAFSQGELILQPAANVAPGDRIRVTVKNDSRRTLHYGLGYELYRSDSGRWAKVDVAPDQAGGPWIELSAKGGETAGPEYGEGLRDAFSVPSEFTPGDYLLARPLSKGPGAGETLYGHFSVSTDSADS